MTHARKSRLCFGLVLTVLAVAAAKGLAAETLTLEVAEEAGIRRFGYPVEATVALPASVTAKTSMHLVASGKPVEAQFTRMTTAGGDARWIVNFNVGLAPLEKRRYTLEYGDGVEPGPKPASGLTVHQDNDSINVGHKGLQFIVPANLLGLLTAVKSPSGDWLADGSPGLYIRYKDDIHFRTGGYGPFGKPTKLEVLQSGPLAAMLRFTGTESLRGERQVESAVEMQFPLSKSWIRVRWTLDDPLGLVAGVGADLNLKLSATDKWPAVADFGANGCTYTTLSPNESALFEAGRKTENSGTTAPLWAVHRGTRDKFAPLVIDNGSSEHSIRAEGWAHLADQQRATAIAVDSFGHETRDRIEISGAGRLQLWRDFVTGGAAPQPGPKTFTFWLHFVDSPPQIGALTSPQSMQRPPRVQVIDK